MLSDELPRCKRPLFHKRPFNGMMETHLKGSIICDEKSFFPMQCRYYIYICVVLCFNYVLLHKSSCMLVGFEIILHSTRTSWQ
jgi:hypothetical protein